MNNLFGQYRHKATFIHMLDPRIKVVFTVFLSVLLFFVNNLKEILLFALFVLFIVGASKIKPLEYLMGIRQFYFMFIFILLMYLFFSRNKIEMGLYSLYRFLMLISISFALTYTTTISNMILAIEKLSSPLRMFGIRPRNIAIMISASVRFIPVMFLVMQRAKDSMSSRLADFGKIKHIKVFMAAVLEKMLKSASNLSDAMHSRLYDENLQSRKIMALSHRDYLSVLAVAALAFLIWNSSAPTGFL